MTKWLAYGVLAWMLYNIARGHRPLTGRPHTVGVKGDDVQL